MAGAVAVASALVVDGTELAGVGAMASFDVDAVVGLDPGGEVGERGVQVAEDLPAVACRDTVPDGVFAFIAESVPEDDSGDGRDRLVVPVYTEFEDARGFLVSSVTSGKSVADAIEALNARYRRAVRVRGHFPTNRQR